MEIFSICTVASAMALRPYSQDFFQKLFPGDFFQRDFRKVYMAKGA